MINPVLKKKLLKTKKRLKEKSSGGTLIFFKPDTTTRLRALPVGSEEEPGREVVYFYLGQKVKGVISPATFGEPCAIMEYFNNLSKKKDADAKELLNSLKPKQRFVLPCITYKDLKGAVVDDQRGVRLALLNLGQYQDLIDLFLDGEDWGDFTDIKTGYDLKFTRVGSGQFDTEYSTKPCQKSRCPQKYRTTVKIDDLIRKEIPTYDETREKLSLFLGEDSDSTGQEDSSVKSRKLFKKKKFKTFKKKPSSDV